MVEVYVVLVATGRRDISKVPAALVEAVQASAKAKIGTNVGGVLLTEELYDTLFVVKK